MDDAAEGKRHREDSSNTGDNGDRKKSRADGQGNHHGRQKRNQEAAREARKNNLCKQFAIKGTCSFGDKCRFVHEREANSDAVISDQCPFFLQYGQCKFGLACRFRSGHTDADNKPIVDEAKWLATQEAREKSVLNVPQREVLFATSRRKYQFPRTKEMLRNLSRQGQQQSQSATTADASASAPATEAAAAAAISSEAAPAAGASAVDDGAADTHTDMDIDPQPGCDDSEACPAVETSASLAASIIAPEDAAAGAADSESAATAARMGEALLSHSTGERVHLREKKLIDFRNKLYLAPLTTVGNLPYRRLCKEFGVDITCSEMAMAVKLIQGEAQEWALTKRHASEDIFGVQLCGGNVEVMGNAAELLSNHCELDFIDVNCGCPIDLVVERGQGSALLSRPSRLETIAKGMLQVSTVPITIKLRTGFSEDRLVAHTLIPRLANLGVSLVTLHGRTRAQRYSRLADWQYINQCAEAAPTLPVYGTCRFRNSSVIFLPVLVPADSNSLLSGNGDIMSYQEAMEHREKTKVSGLMLARGALIKPWVFTEIKESRTWDISSGERFDMLKKFVNYGLEHWGSDTRGVETTRRFLLEWQSFLCRYVPAELVEVLPQRIHERPQPFYGRNDLETLMASRNAADWLKLSEMLLGPVPGDFNFQPKHIANSYSG
ncbi:tRNA-dihydrouridine synthase 3 [Capsaspora owczarzaki ATCC 30864]|uniref:tRNA-dihydrouridine(47) synthase [NAD(P)(+)] n=2 Tax=Capsaspora owczarzaki (strain ATCC 30864) TaxID=595528 RepID=A0A0D2WM98_CAPO3|nr:tRNA-dihydrouridine synthase 3 [Capsaspora owczarzaki ATCC 30864]